MSNYSQHEMLDYLTQSKVYIYRVYYGLILINFDYNYVGMFYHKITFSGKYPKYHSSN